MTELTETTALERMRQGDETGLHWFIGRYTRYVTTIVWNIIGHTLTAQDAEEVTADVFMTLWRYCQRPMEGKAKSYLGAIARTRALNRLKKSGLTLSLEYDELELAADGPEGAVIEQEAQVLIRAAVDNLPAPDREIFLRHYYYCEPSVSIAQAMGMTPEAVRQRLKRGRDRLRSILLKGGVL